MTVRWRLTIPKQHYEGFRRLADLTHDQFESLHHALRDVSPEFSIEHIVQQVSEISGVGDENTAEIVTMATSLHGVQDDLQAPISPFVDALMEALERVPGDAKVAPNSEPILRQRLTLLLEDTDPIAVVAKAVTLWSEFERNFIDARVVSDVRPLFGDDPSNGPLAAMLVHSLRIAYLEDGERREFFVSLASSDLRQLQRALDRAEKKAESLRVSLSSTIRILEEEE